ncbi:Rho termination factor N-terminal domain-containing protein [Ornithinimicrobium sufpigmenti]|uniref:Rho termination factor N-terminal domain-containing protein n=1 Tax=Ornithinimicrobium sufpigmenti TaxID=2508882 RepID=UPI00103617EC|nr:MULTISPECIES: Rho termination factor N-terminal domain-containing protein [unclassified Ornithinimicrobium]
MHVHHPRPGYTGSARIGRTTLAFKDGVAEAPEDLTRRRWERNGYRVTEQAQGNALEDLTVKELRELAAQRGIDSPTKVKKAQIIEAINAADLPTIGQDEVVPEVEGEPGGDTA